MLGGGGGGGQPLPPLLPWEPLKLPPCTAVSKARKNCIWEKSIPTRYFLAFAATTVHGALLAITRPTPWHSSEPPWCRQGSKGKRKKIPHWGKRKDFQILRFCLGQENGIVVFKCISAYGRKHYCFCPACPSECNLCLSATVAVVLRQYNDYGRP